MFEKKKNLFLAPPPPAAGIPSGKRFKSAPAIPMPSFSPPSGPPLPSSKAAKISDEIDRLDNNLSKDRESLLDRLKEKDNENLILQQKFLEKEKSETQQRRKKLELLKEKLEEKYIEREEKLSLEREKWQQTIEEIRKENKRNAAIQQTQEQIRQQSLMESQKKLYNNIEKLKEELESTKKQAYEEKIKRTEEEKNSIKVEQALKEVLQGVSRTQKVEQIEAEKEVLGESLHNIENELIQQKVQFVGKLKESESLRDNLRLDYQNRLKEEQLNFENKISQLHKENTLLNNRIFEIQYKFDTKKEIWQERVRDKNTDTEKVISDFQRKLSEIKYEYQQEIFSLKKSSETALKELYAQTKEFENSKLELNSKIITLQKEKDLIEKESAIKFNLIEEKIKEKENELQMERRLHQEKLMNMRNLHTENKKRWDEKIYSVQLKEKETVNAIKNEFEKKLSDYEREITDLNSKKQEIDYKYSKVKRELADALKTKDAIKIQTTDEYNGAKKHFEEIKKEIEERFIHKIETLKKDNIKQNEEIQNIKEEKKYIESEAAKEIELITSNLNESRLKERQLLGIVKEIQLESESFNNTAKELNKRNGILQDKLLKSTNEKEDISYNFQREIQNIQRKKNVQIQELEERYMRQIEEIEKQVSVARQAISSLRKDKDFQIQAITEEFNNYKKNYDWLKEEWNSQKDELRQNFIEKESQYKQEIFGIQKQLEEAEKLRISDAEKFQQELAIIRKENGIEIKKYETKINELQSDFNIEREELSGQYSKETAELKNKIKIQADEISSISAIKIETENKIKELNMNIENIQGEASMWEKRYNTQLDENKIIKMEVEKSENYLKNQIDDLKEKYEELLNTVQKKWKEKEKFSYISEDELRYEINKLRKENSMSDRLLAEKDTELEKLRMGFEEYKDQTDRYLSEMKENAAGTADINKEIFNIKASKDRLEKEFAKLQADMQEKDSEIDELKTQIEAISSEKNNETAQTFIAKEEEIKKLRMDYDNTVKGIIIEKEQLQNRLSELQSDTQIKDSKIAQLKTQIEAISSEKNNEASEISVEFIEKEKEIKKLRMDYDNICKELAETRSGMQQKLDEISSGNKKLEDEINSKQKVILELTTGLEEAIKEIENKDNIPQEINDDKINELNALNKELNNQIGELKAQLEVGLEELRNSIPANADNKNEDIEKNWRRKWQKREQEVNEFIKKFKNTTQHNKNITKKLQIAIADQKTLSQLAQKEANEKKELQKNYAELMQIFQKSKKSFFKKIADKIKGAPKGVVIL